MVFAQLAESGSVTVTAVSVTSPVFVTVIVNVAVPPESTAWVPGVFVIVIAGWMTVTLAFDDAVTSGPTGGVPIEVAVLVRFAVTFASVQEEVDESFGAKVL